MRGHEEKEKGGWKREVLKSPVTQAGTMAFAALVHTAWKDHRVKTHRAIELSPAVDLMMDIAGGAFTDTNRWAATHRIHHSTPDANLVPFIELKDCIEWLNGHPEIKIDRPVEVAGLDPALPRMLLEDATEIGGLATKLVDGQYTPQQEYTSEELERILHGTDPRYFYEETSGDKDAVPTLGDEPSLHDLRFLLRDPHSPTLRRDGMRGIAIKNRILYDDVVTFYRKNPQFMPEDIVTSPREQWIEDHKKQVRVAMVAANVLARLAIERPKSVGEGVKSGVRGIGAAVIGTLGLISGGNIVNSLGHGGQVKLTSKEFWQDMTTGKVRVSSNGTYETDNLFLSPQTLGEVGGQKEHHGDPSLIAYTHETGLKAWVIDPFGMTTKLLAERGIGLKVGKGFDGPRPDDPSIAVLRLEEMRRRHYRAQQSNSSDT